MSDIAWQSIVTIVSTLAGFEAVRRSVLHQMHNKVDVLIYQTKVTELHNTINSLRERVIVLETERHR